MNGPAPKRLRLTDPSDPSIPLANGSSPFQIAPQDVVDHIFRHLADGVVDTKEKMQLEMVCSLFRRRITQRVCWIWNNELGLAYFDKIRINRTEFLANVASAALAIFLQRTVIWKVEFRETEEYPIPVALDLQTQLILHRQSFMLRIVEFEQDATVVGVGDAIILNGLAACNLSQLQTMIVFQQGCTDDFKAYFWSFVFRCHNLTKFSLQVSEGTGILDNVDQLAVRCPNIQTFKILDHSRTDMEGLAPLFANLQKLNYITLFIGPFDFNLINSLDNHTRSRIETVKLQLSPNTEENEEFLLTVPILFPNLKQFVPNHMNGSIRWNTDFVSNLIQIVVNNYSGRGPYKLIMKMRVKHKETFVGLMQAVNINVVIDHDQCLLKCRKDELLILLDF